MKYSEIEKLLVDILQQQNATNDWLNLAEMGIRLKKHGIPYARLSNFLKSFSHILEIKQDDGFPPISYVRLKNS